MKTPTLLISTLWLVTQATAAIVTYPSLNVTQSPGVSATISTGPVAIDAAHVYTDPDSGATASATRYYGGTIDFSATGSEWGWRSQIILDGPANPSLDLEAGGGQTNWRLTGISGSVTDLSPAASTFDYVIKISDLDWNTSQVSIFIGAAANTVSEGSPTGSYVIANSPLVFSTIEVKSFRDSWGDASTLVTSNMFSSTEWTPVSAIPEPSTYAALAGALALGLVAYRRRR